MALIWWLTKLQGSIIVDRLTYEKSWSVDRVSSLLLGTINLFLVSISYLHHTYWLIPLGLINFSALAYVIANKYIFQEFLISLGFEKKETILMYRRNQLIFNKQIKDSELFTLTTNQSNDFVFEILSSKEIIHNFNNSDVGQ